ncbi:hypothetical protein [Pseudoalteromonas luteoviolacea]|uniref:hypothetical protein n=1 Tax=Pseudoalteromonas luteoviolacea TaxID=43657 RepID=UPI001B35D221|nr:hypothetical protein [Pseudoalteromonas luteoviolacea]MBQ4839793.1 hypothetical protein [Pseudoalteromonas luteoviolacea]
MALYISIDENYCARKLNGLIGVLRESEGYTFQDGRIVTKKLAQLELKSGSLNLYKYDDEELEQAKLNGSVRGGDWTIKILKL